MANLRASSFMLGELEHPNKMPFSGVLTWLDAPSDNPPHGSDGRLVVIPSDVGVPALESLVGMAVNYVPGTMDGHNPQEKIGVITGYSVGEAYDDGAVPVYINGFIYALDFPEAALDVKLNQSLLGFSYETARTLLADGKWHEIPVALVQDLGYFTGASILLKNKAAYETTSIAASTNEELKEGEMMDEFMEKVLAAIADLKTYVDVKLDASKKDVEKVDTEVKADDGETAEVIGEVETDEEAKEEVATEENATEVSADMTTETAEMTETTETVDVQAESEVNASVDLQAQLDAAQTELADLRAYKATQEATRKSIAYPTTMLAKFDINPEDDYDRMMASIDERKDLNIEERLALKMELRLKKAKEQK